MAPFFIFPGQIHGVIWQNPQDMVCLFIMNYYWRYLVVFIFNVKYDSVMWFKDIARNKRYLFATVTISSEMTHNLYKTFHTKLTLKLCISYFLLWGSNMSYIYHAESSTRLNEQYLLITKLCFKHQNMCALSFILCFLLPPPPAAVPQW